MDYGSTNRIYHLNAAYAFYKDSNARVKKYTDGSDGYYWLRSVSKENNGAVGYVDDGGNLRFKDYNDTSIGAGPALSLETNQSEFHMIREYMDKTQAFGKINAAPNNKEWFAFANTGEKLKLTNIDSEAAGDVYAPGETVEFAIEKLDKNVQCTQISAYLVCRDAYNNTKTEALFGGKVQVLNSDGSDSIKTGAKFNINIPDNLPAQSISIINICAEYIDEENGIYYYTASNKAPRL